MGSKSSQSDVVPPGCGRAYLVNAGSTIAIEQVEGGQVADLFAFDRADPQEHLSASHTRLATERLFPAVGECFVTTQRQSILRLRKDTSPGRHDLLIAACDPMRYELLGHPGHASCAQNLVDALGTVAVSSPVIPQPVNLFMDVRSDPQGALSFLPSPALPGDRVELEATRDLVIAISACPQDLTPINGGRLGSLAVEITGC